jgi:hypothetical protein
MRDSLNPWKREKGLGFMGGGGRGREEGFRVFLLFNKFCCFSNKKDWEIFGKKNFLA